MATADGELPQVPDVAALTPERLTELRGALAAFASAPLVTLEAHPLAERRAGSSGISLGSASPLAQELGRLLARSPRDVPAVADVAASGEVLYRMVVPAKVAADVGKGLVKPMSSRAVSGGVYGDLVNTTSRIAAKASFVPVTASAGAGATAGTAGAVTAVTGTTAAAAAVTVAAPLVLMAVAVGASAYADQQRQKAIENITGLLEKLHSDKLDEERDALEACIDAIDKATSLLLDQGRIGASLGLDSAVHSINNAIQRARGRLSTWEKKLEALGADRVEAENVAAAFPGIDEEGGEFQTHLEIAALAIALKRRVIVLQGVDAGQGEPGNAFANFVRNLNADQQKVDELEARLSTLLLRLSALELRPPRGLRDRLMTRGQVNDLLKASYRLREFGQDVATGPATGEVVIEIEQHQDGSLFVLPAAAV